MSKEENNWINISFGDEEESVTKLNESIKACHKIHNWTVRVLNSYWIKHLEMPKYPDFRKTLSQFILREGLVENSQRYSLDRAAEKTFPYISSKMKIDDEMNVVLPLPIPISKYKEIQVKSRMVWKKYLTQSGLLTTFYGNLFPDSNWETVLKSQVGEEYSSSILMPHSLHSITIANNNNVWQMKFNIHNVNVKANRKGINDA